MLHRFLAIFLLFPTLAIAQSVHNPQPFGLWVQELRADALAQGIDAELFDRAFAAIEPLPRVVELDRKQPESSIGFEEYIAKVVPDARVQKARELLAENRALLEKVSAEYGVQPRFIVSLWAVESNFGERMGNFEIIEALATLAYDGRRPEFFRKELLNALTIVNQGHISLEDMKGSWAGAMGQSQFMPSSFLRYAVDGNGDGKKDIWGTREDVFASIANYLHSEGWDGDAGWGRRVTLPPGFDTSLADIKQERGIAEWAKLGVKRSGGGTLPASDRQASLVSVDKDGGGPYYLVYNNYKVILKWNRSRYFATAVGTLADKISGRGADE